MTDVLVWKVYREQRQVWLVMAFLAIGAVILRLTLLERELRGEALAQLFYAFAYGYGMVVGAVLMAGEREAGTAAFLECLPAQRFRVWRVKCAAGIGLVLAQALYLAVILLPLDPYSSPQKQPGVVLGWLTSMALLGFAWGLFFSGRAQTSLAAIFFALVSQVVVFFGATILLGVASGATKSATLMEFGWNLVGLVQVVGLIAASGINQARRDQEQSPDWARSNRVPLQATLVDGWGGDSPEPSPLEARQGWLEVDLPGDGESQAARAQPRAGRASAALAPTVREERASWFPQLRALIWLDLRQAGRLFLGLAIVAFLAGMLPWWVVVWPLATLVLGAIAGVSVFAGEQTQSSGRFLAEQRLPLGKIWVVKVGVRLALAFGVVHLLLLPAGAVAAFRSLGATGNENGPATEFSRLAPYLQMGPFLTLGLGHGFSIGCLFGLLFRKPAIAGLITVAAALLVLILWFPSMIVGGLHVWQYWGLPVLLLLTTRALVWSWAAGQLGDRGPLLRLATGLTLAILWFAGAIAYRVVEVPLVEDTLDLAGFEKELETARRTETGFRVQTLLHHCETKIRASGLAAAASTARAGLLAPGMPLPQRGLEPWLKSRMSFPWVVPWLNETFRDPWAGDLAAAVRRPLGVVGDVTTMMPHTGWNPNEGASLAVNLLVARGLQLQAEGNPAPFVDHLATALALLRQARHLKPTRVVGLYQSIEPDLLAGLERWLERLDGRPDLLRRVVTLLREHEQASLEELDQSPRADYLVARNAVQRPESWAFGLVWNKNRGSPLAALLSPSWRTPWEAARLERLVRQLANLEIAAVPLPPPITRANLFPRLDPHSKITDPRDTTRLRVWELIVALRLYQAEIGRPARTLEELTPRILDSVPKVRGTGEPFGYRLSEDKGQPAQGTLIIRGETFPVPPPPGPGEGKEMQP